MSTQFEQVKATSLRFLNEVIPSTLGVRKRMDVWKTLDPEDRGRAEELRHEIRKLTRELALAMEQSAVLTKTDIPDIGRVGERTCGAALRVEEYAGIVVDCGEPLRILESGVDAIEQWIDFSSRFSGSHRRD